MTAALARTARSTSTENDAPGLLGAWIPFLFGFSILASVDGWPALPSATQELVLAITMVYAFAESIRSGHRFRLLVLTLTLFGAYSAVSLLSVLGADDSGLALETWLKLLRAQLIGVTGFLLAARLRRLRWLTWGAAAGAGSTALVAVLGGPGPFRGLSAVDVSDRIIGPLSDPNFFGQFLAVGAALAIGLMRRERLAVPWIAGAASLGMALVAILGTESRGAALALLIVAAALLPRRVPVRRLAVLVLVAATALMFLLGSTPIGERLSRAPASVNSALDDGVAEDTAVAGRLSENIAAAHMVRDHPVLGVGIGNYHRNYLDYARHIGLDDRLEPRSAHNLHLEVVAETGLLGGAVWVVLLACVFFELVGTSRHPGTSAGLARLSQAWIFASLAWVVTSLFLHDNFPDLQWFILGACLGVGEARQSESSRGDVGHQGDRVGT